jgi:hypothetical protein
MKWAKELKIPKFHVLMRDEIKSIKKKPSCSAICNLHTKEQDGVHWSCLYKTPEISYYFDSYGLIPTKEVEAVLSKPYIYSTFQLQTNEKFCGVLCLYVLYELSNGGRFEDIVLDMYDSLNCNKLNSLFCANRSIPDFANIPRLENIPFPFSCSTISVGESVVIVFLSTLFGIIKSFLSQICVDFVSI